MSIVSQEPRAKSVIMDMADQYGMEPEAFEATLRKTVVPAACTREQFAAFLLVARDYKLNPILKEIYAMPTKGGAIQPIVSVDGWVSLVNRHPDMDGLEFTDIKDEAGKLTAIEARIYRKSRARPTAVTEYMAECAGTSEPWKRWPARMLRHKATIQCARLAFGFSGIMEPDEYDRMVDVTPAPPRPKREDFTTSKVTEVEESKIKLFDEFGEDAGSWIPSKAMQLFSEMVEGKIPSSVISIYEINGAAIDALGDAGINMDHLAALYAEAQKALEPPVDETPPVLTDDPIPRIMTKAEGIAIYNQFDDEMEKTENEDQVNAILTDPRFEEMAILHPKGAKYLGEWAAKRVAEWRYAP